MLVFLPRSKHLLISQLQPTICNDFGAQESKDCHYFHCFPIYLPRSDGTRCHDLSFLNVEYWASFSLSSFTFLKRLFSPSYKWSITFKNYESLCCTHVTYNIVQQLNFKKQEKINKNLKVKHRVTIWSSDFTSRYI